MISIEILTKQVKIITALFETLRLNEKQELTLYLQMKLILEHLEKISDDKIEIKILKKKVGEFLDKHLTLDYIMI